MCFYQVTTHSHLLSSDEVEELGDSLQLSENPDVDSFILQEFDTELDFTSKVRYAKILYLKAQNITFSPHHLLGCELEPANSYIQNLGCHLSQILVAIALHMYSICTRLHGAKHVVGYSAFLLCLAHIYVRSLQSFCFTQE